MTDSPVSSHSPLTSAPLGWGDLITHDIVLAIQLGPVLIVRYARPEPLLTQLPSRTIDIDYSSNLGVSPKTSNLFVLLLLHVDSISIHSLNGKLIH